MTKTDAFSSVDHAGPSKQQPRRALASSASASETLNAPVQLASAAPTTGPSLAEQAAALCARLKDRPLPYTCKVALKIAFFFDGTANNLDADEGTNKQSNVARLFKAYPDDLESQGVYAYYIPGLGTYFREIGDIGDDDGLTFGKYGDARLSQAMKWLDEAIAKHPADKIERIDLAVFGFSRGSALARAFVRRVQDRCNRPRDASFIWPSVGKPCSVYFLGLFDTVASVALPASTSSLSVAIARKWTTLERGLAERRDGYLGTGLRDIAFGTKPGADPTQAVYDGHMSWARNLRIPPIVTRTVHLMATNEVRNSFPLDTVWDGFTLPSGASEYVYPGAHSDVGGGYRPGEGAKSLEAEMLLSKLPLRKMHDEARMNGVPLESLDHPRIQSDFVYSSAMAERFNKVLATAGFRQGRLGDALLSHMEIYYRWRFRKIRLRLRASEKEEIDRQEARFRRDAKGDPASGTEGLEARLAQLENDPDRLAAQREMNLKKSAWLSAVQFDPGLEHENKRTAYLDAKKRFDDINDAYLRERGKLRALPEHEGELVGNLDVYDRNLITDVETLKRLEAESSAPLRPHYQRLMNAYLDEFERGKGLTDPLVIDFFDSFVHDSLAGFARDATLPSDPRCCYIGGDEELKFADNHPISERRSQTA